MVHFDWAPIFQHGVGRNTTYCSNLFVFVFGWRSLHCMSELWHWDPGTKGYTTGSIFKGKTYAELQMS